MNIPIKASLHNRFDIFKKDVRTGEEKQVGYAENIILNQYWTYALSSSNFSSDFFRRIALGRGTGTLSASRTNLFNEIVLAIATKENTVYNLNEKYMYNRFYITRIETDDVGENYTEVGLSSYISNVNRLMTHALIKDMNGNPVSILKTNTDIITIYATFYLRFAETSWYTGSVYLAYPDLFFFRHLVGGYIGSIESNYTDYQMRFQYWPASYGRSGVDITNWSNQYVESSTLTVTYDVANKKASFYYRLPAATGNTGSGLVTDFKGFSRVTMQNLILNLDTVWTPQSGAEQDRWNPDSDVLGEALGSGNGVVTQFKTVFSQLRSGVVIKVDGVAVPAEDVTVILLMPGSTRMDCQFVWSSEHSCLYNPFYENCGIISAYGNYQTTLQVSQDGVNWMQVGYRNSSGTMAIAATYRRWPYWRVTTGSMSGVATDIATVAEMYNVIFATPPGLVTGEAIGVGDGSDVTFDLAHTPIAGSLTVKLDGAATSDYTLDGTTITFTTAPGSGVVITADYRHTCATTADYKTPLLAKDANHVLDLTIEMTLNEYIP